MLGNPTGPHPEHTTHLPRPHPIHSLGLLGFSYTEEDDQDGPALGLAQGCQREKQEKT